LADWFEEWFDEDYAELYAHRDTTEARRAVELALRVAPELAAGPALDLGCGSGRHLEVLRGVNPQAFGMDLSRALLGLAPAELRPWLLRGDMRALPLRPGVLSGICLWFTPFGYFGDQENRSLLQHLAGLLRPGGVLLLDYLNADLVERTLVPEDTAERKGTRIRSRRSIEGNRLMKRLTLTRLATGEVREALESVQLYHPAELQELARAAGLRVRTILGNYTGESFTSNSPRWIGVFQRHGTADLLESN
jgi:SAM-dependent methyltransferase